MTENYLKSIAQTVTTIAVILFVWAGVDLGTRAYVWYQVEQVERAAEQAVRDAKAEKQRKTDESNCRHWAKDMLYGEDIEMNTKMYQIFKCDEVLGDGR